MLKNTERGISIFVDYASRKRDLSQLAQAKRVLKQEVEIIEYKINNAESLNVSGKEEYFRDNLAEANRGLKALDGVMSRLHEYITNLGILIDAMNAEEKSNA